jgi:hypothetical protein
MDHKTFGRFFMKSLCDFIKGPDSRNFWRLSPDRERRGGTADEEGKKTAGGELPDPLPPSRAPDLFLLLPKRESRASLFQDPGLLV